MRLSFQIAIRFLLSSKTQSLLILLGISVGVSVQVFIGCLIEGLQKNLLDKTVGSASHITIKADNKEKTIPNVERTLYEAKISSPEILHVSPAAEAMAFAVSNTENESVLVRGIDFAAADKIYKLQNALVAGTAFKKDFEVIIGKELAEILQIAVGDRLILLNPVGASSQVRVVGFFDLQVASINQNWILTTIKTAQRLFGYGERITSIEMQVEEPFGADALAKKVQYILSTPDLLVENWKEQNAQLLSGLNGQSSSSYMIQFFVIVAVTLGIASVLAVSVVQKSRQIGILKAMGIQDAKASLIFVFQGLLLGVGGAVIGISLGYGLLVSFSTFVVDASGKPVVPLYVSPNFISISALIAIFSAVLASLVPARLSIRLNPIEVIRNGG